MDPAPRTFWLPRDGHDAAEYEDAYAVNPAAGRFAVADGATEGCFTGLWARLLVEQFVADEACAADDWPAALPDLQQRWDTTISARPLPWYAESGVRQGAYAAFLGVVLGPHSAGACPWQAVAVGDCCLLHTRGRKLLQAFPVEHAAQFSNSPPLIGSRMPREGVTARRSLWLQGQGRAGDRLWMMTDALAHWSLAEGERDGEPWAELEAALAAPAAEPHFAGWIAQLRAAGRLRNDDVTLVAIPL